MAQQSGALGVGFTTRPVSQKDAGAFGVSFTLRDIQDAAGILGVGFTLPTNTQLSLVLTNASAIVLPLTISMAWAGHSAEVYTYNPATFVYARQFPSGTLITITTSGTGYQTQSVTFTPADGSVLAVTVPVAYASQLNTFRRRRTGK